MPTVTQQGFRKFQAELMKGSSGDSIEHAFRYAVEKYHYVVFIHYSQSNPLMALNVHKRSSVENISPM